MIPMPLTGMLPLSIPFPRCGTFGFTRSSVVAQDYRSSFSILPPANFHDAPLHNPCWRGPNNSIRSILELSIWTQQAWGLRLIAWIHTVLGAVAVVAWNTKNRKNRSCLPPTWTKEELGKRSGIERFGCLAFSSFSICNVLRSWAGLRSLHRSP